MATFRGLQGFCLWVSTSPDPGFSFFSLLSLRTHYHPLVPFKPPFSSCCKERPAPVPLASPHLCPLIVCASLHTHCLFVCLLYKPCSSSPSFTPSSSFSQAAFSILFPFHSFLFCPYPTTPALVSVLGLWPLKSMIQVLWQVSGKPCTSSFPPHRFYSVHDSDRGPAHCQSCPPSSLPLLW